MQQGGDGGELELAARDEEGQLLGRGFGLVGTRHDGGAQLVVGRQDAVIQNGMRPRRRHEGAQPSEKGVGAHLGEGGPEAVRLLEVHPDLSVGGALYGIEGEGRLWGDFTASNQQVGGGNSNGTWPENSLDALHLAATQFAWRPADETTRLVIHTTDDTFWEGPSTQNGVAIQNDYASTVAALQAETIRVFAFADTIGGSCGCLDVSMGWFGDYEGMPSIPDATDGGVYDINEILSNAVSLADAIGDSVEQSYCDEYDPAG